MRPIGARGRWAAGRGPAMRLGGPARGWFLARRVLVCLGVSAAGLVGGASAQLRPEQVLVVYDSRVLDSVLVAEHYAGSAKVVGGVGGRTGTRPGVRVFDLATGGAAAAAPGTITYANFITRIRTPLREYLAGSGLAEEVRCIVMTKGLPHRVRDTDNANSGDSPSQTETEFFNRDVTNASMESELALLWQDLSAGEAGGAADSFADGMIVNPWWSTSEPVQAYRATHIREPKSFVAAFASGRYWTTTSTVPASALGPGDVYLVCRLDGHTVDDVRGMLDRAAGLVVDLEDSVVVLDESGSDGVPTPTPPPDTELDNQHAIPQTNGGDDYELTRDYLYSDGRVLFINVWYDALSDEDNFIVGPNLSFDGEGSVCGTPVILLAHYGANHAGTFPGGISDPDARSLYASSFTYARGAIFNTMESFNARAFGGLTTLQSQEQAADFIAAGGTFAVGNVYEPFATTVPDNLILARNFLLGNLTWAEAAWSSIPFLSWQQTVIGDPLARVVRRGEDLNGDGVVDVEDLHAWERAPTDINHDSAINDADRQLLVRTVRAFERYDMENGRR